MRQIIATPLLGPARLLGGERGLDQAVRDVVYRSTGWSASGRNTGVLLVLDGRALEDHAYRIDHTLRALSESGGSGLVLANAKRPPDLGPIRLANQFNIPFLTIEGVAPADLAYELRATYWAPDVDQAAKLDALFEAIAGMRHPTAESLIAMATGVSGVPLALIDRNRQHVAGTPLEIADRRLAQRVGHLVDHGGTESLHSVPIALAPGEPVSYWLCASSGGPQAGERVLGTVLQTCGWYLTALLASARMRHERAARRRMAVLNEVLEPGGRPEAELRRQLQDIGWSISGWNMGLYISLRGLQDAGRIVDWHAELTHRLETRGVNGPVVERTDGWTGWITFEAEPSAATYASVTATVGAALQDFVASHAGLVAHAGVGRPSSDLAGLRRSLAEAQEASLIARSRGHGATGAAHIDQLGVRRVLMGWFGSDEFRLFAGSMLEPLVTIDRDGALLRTLEAFLDAAGSASLTAADLGIHRNTVTNRIGRIQAVLGADLGDPEVRLSLQLACRMVRLGDAEH